MIISFIKNIKYMIDLVDSDITDVRSLAFKIEKYVMKLCPLLSYTLCALFFGLMFGLSYFAILLIFTLEQQLGSWLYVHFIVLMWIIFNIVFNYIMCLLVKPGSPSNIPNSILLEIRHTCRKCGNNKPPRTHHCSICNDCILQMDHHCPWIGTCVGHHNRRYFVNFLTYLNLGLAQIYLLSMHKSIDYLVYVLVVTLLVCLVGFAAFHWYIVLKGQTTIEACWRDPRYQPSKSFSTNLKIVFGTSNLFCCLLPSVTVLQNWGHQWRDI